MSPSPKPLRSARTRRLTATVEVEPTGETLRKGPPWRRVTLQRYHCTLSPEWADPDPPRPPSGVPWPPPPTWICVSAWHRDDDEAEEWARGVLSRYLATVEANQALRARRRAVTP